MSASTIKNIVLTLFICTLVIIIVFLQFRYEIEWNLKNGKLETEQVIDRLSNVMLVPPEEPSIAQLIDVQVYKDRNPEFFKDAENLNYLIVYKNLAIIFDARTNKIINVGPIVAN